MIKEMLRKLKPVVSVYHFLYAFLGAALYFFPSRKIKVFAVTGTNGKTTTVDLVARVFKEAGFKVAAFSSVKFEIAGEEEPNLFKMTMPGRTVIQGMLRKAVKKGCQIAILEVTSEGIKQHRHRFINFDVACFTNLSPEHIESHGGFENYRKEKGKLFQAVKNTHIINIDDENADYFLKFPCKKKIQFGVKNKEAGLRAEDVKSVEGGVEFMVKDEKFYLNLNGSFNVYNALAAIAFAKEEKISTEKIKKAFQEIDVVPGRMEEVISSPFRVIVDYAVTPVTLEGVYKEILNNFSPKKLIAVFGSCGGGRDKWKRPVLGEIAAKYCDKIILTDEDPYNENPKQILSEIKPGILNSQFSISNFYEIIDRREAIKKALEIAEAGDVVIITGKGSEPWMCLANGQKIPWDDRKIIREEFEKVFKA